MNRQIQKTYNPVGKLKLGVWIDKKEVRQKTKKTDLKRADISEAVSKVRRRSK